MTLSREMFGPDVVASVTSRELKQLVEGVRFIERILANPVDKTELSASATEMRDIFFKSVVPLADLPADTVLEAGHITTKKPGTGIPASQFDNLIGRTLARDVKKDQPLVAEDFDEDFQK